MSQPGRHAAIDFGLQTQSAMNVTDTEGQSIVPKSHNPILLNRHAAAKVLISHPGLFEARGNGCAQLPSLRSGNPSRTLSGTLHAIATRVRHARQTTITVASSHARAIPAAKALRAVAIFLRELAKTAEQLTGLQRWRRILARAFQVFLQGRQLRSPPRLAPS